MTNLDALDDLVDASLAAADRTIAEVQQRTEQRLAEEAEQWRAFATGPDAPAEWRRVAERVESSELRWHDLANGDLWTDPDVAAAMAAGRPAPVLPEDLDDELAESPLRRD